MRQVTLLVLIAACGDNLAAPKAQLDARAADAAPDAAYNPMTLFDTGLCVDRACTMISPDIQTYTPRWALYADGATKKRWCYIPGPIDTSDMDHWQFPVGTKFWKEFDAPDGSGGSTRVETRLEERIGSGDSPNDWFYVAFEWNATNDDTMAVPNGVTDANGTMHDIPTRQQCHTCHEGFVPTRVLGFGALQLDAAAAATGDTTLADLVAARTLTVNPPGTASPFFPFEATGDTLDALGYLHANCGHCHNPTSPIYASQTMMALRLEVATVGTTAMTPTYQTAVGHMTTLVVNGHDVIVDPGSPTTSVMIDRFDDTTADPNYMMTHMPQLGTKVVDPVGDATLHAWITSIPRVVNGVLVLDKPAGLSSATAVDHVKRALGVRRAGHGGTLDPIATGVLAVCLGEATKLAQYLLADDKAYEADGVLGIETDTLDRTGAVTATRPFAHVTRDAVERALAGRRGEQDQIPPMFSALKRGGVPLYKQARRGIEVEREPRRIRIDRLELLELAPPYVRLAIACTKGTYIRSLVADLGTDLGCGAHLAELRRTRSGAFDLADAQRLDALDPARILAMGAVLPLPRVHIPALLVPSVLAGVQHSLDLLAAPAGERFQLLDETGGLLAVAHGEAGRVVYDRVFAAGA